VKEKLQSLEASFERGQILKKALEEIRDKEGKVCANYELCHDVSCQSSYASWAIADIALRKIDGKELNLTL
jgi:hypothetical protein